MPTSDANKYMDASISSTFRLANQLPLTPTHEMSSVPVFAFNNGVKVPAIGEINMYLHGYYNVIDLLIHLGLGGWTGLDPKEQEAARGWFLTGLQVSNRHLPLAALKTNNLNHDRLATDTSM